MIVPFLDLSIINGKLLSELTEIFSRCITDTSLVLGDSVDKFEGEYAQSTQTKHCVAVASGLDALTLLLRAHNIGLGDEVIVPAQTFIATWFSVAQTGAKIVPVDISLETYNIDIVQIKNLISTRTKAIVAVHLCGQICDILQLKLIAAEYNILLIEDAAQAHGASFKGYFPGELSDGAAWSFYPGKNLGCLGDGGAVTTQNSVIADKIRLLRNYGSSVKYHHELLGWNSRLDSIQAAFLSLKLTYLDDHNLQRNLIARRYLENIINPKIILPKVSHYSGHSWHLFSILTANRDALQVYLDDHGIQTLIHYPSPPFLQPVFSAEFSDCELLYPNALLHSQQTLSIPIGPHLKPYHIDYVIHALNSY